MKKQQEGNVTRIIAIILLAAMLCAVIPARAAAAQEGMKLNAVYLDMTDGDDANSGDKGSPVLTFTKAKSLLNRNGIIHLVGFGNVPTDEKEWSLPASAYGEAKMVVEESASGNEEKILVYNTVLTLKDITIEGPGLDKPLRVQGGIFVVSGGLDLGESATLRLGENCVIRNFALQLNSNAIISASSNGTVILDGAALTNNIAVNGIISLPMTFEKHKNRLQLKSGRITTGGSSDKAYSGYTNAAIYLGMDSVPEITPTGKLRIDGGIYAADTKGGAIEVEIPAYYPAQSVQKNGYTWRADQDGIYRADRQNAGNIVTSIIAEPGEMQVAATYADGKKSIQVDAAIRSDGGAVTQDSGKFTVYALARDNYVIDRIEITKDGEPADIDLSAAQGQTAYEVPVTGWSSGAYAISAYFTYTLHSVLCGEYGTLTVSRDGETLERGALLRTGDTITLTAESEQYYLLDALTINGVDVSSEVEGVVNDAKGHTYTFTGHVGDFGETDDGAALLATFIMDPNVPVESVEIDKSVLPVTADGTRQMSLTVGGNRQMTATVEPVDFVAYNAARWESSDQDVAVVSADGWVYGMGEGTATISVTTLDGGYTDSFQVTVRSAFTQTIYIDTLDEFLAFAADVNRGNDYAGKLVCLTTDLDLSDVYDSLPSPPWHPDDAWDASWGWTPIGTKDLNSGVSVPFSGVFDGGGHTISGLMVDNNEGNYPRFQTHSLGLFGYVEDGIIKNVVLDGNIAAFRYIGTIAGRVQNSVIYNCINRASVQAYQTDAGGIAYTASGSVFLRCENYGTVKVAKNNVAGIVTSNSGSIIDCYNAGDVRATGGAGGMAVSAGLITGCVNAGTVDDSMSAGGIASGSSGIISNCYNLGLVHVPLYASSYAHSKSGGIVASATNGTVENCYNLGRVENGTTTGAYAYFIVGSVGHIKNCYYLADLKDESYVAYEDTWDSSGAEKTAEEIKALAGELGSAFAEDTMALNNGYPILNWQTDMDAYSITLDYERTAANALTVTSRGMEQENGGNFSVLRSKDVEFTLSMNKAYTVDAITAGSGTATLTSSEVIGNTGTYTYNLTGIFADTTLTITLKDAEEGGNDSVFNSSVSTNGTWDGKIIDVSWYLANPDAASYDISTAEAFAGAAALINGLVNNDVEKIWISSTEYLTAAQWNDPKNGYVHSGNGDSDAGGGSYHYGIESFKDKTIRLTADIDMGATYAYGSWDGPNYMPLGGQYLMTQNDISTLIGASFCGTLNGNGHYVLNIYCNRHADNYNNGQSVGLIGRLGVHDNESGSSLEPASPGVYDVGVTGYILSNRSVGGIVGKIGRTSSTATISGCVNYASVNNTDAKGLGGIVGAGWNKGKIINCYNMGRITSTYTCPTGGISGSNEVPITNCYNAGYINAGSSSYAMAIGTNNAGAAYDSYIINCWYEYGSASGGYFNGTGDVVNSGVTAKLKDDEMAEKLGSAYMPDTNGINGGYAILTWQDRAAAVADSIAEEAT
ncbi:MAG: Ig-like domain-containing protein [Oscillospiraceae bacterium]|nr:Ig-like domain-containing protein [Oscillospiraceae bacterium]